LVIASGSPQSTEAFALFVEVPTSSIGLGRRKVKRKCDFLCGES
jgi:hypothetical protein